uniref:FliH/SctL family protein n=1 Tax=Acetatifactor sp. TaxID=1872090 RepID=UPI004056242F
MSSNLLKCRYMNLQQEDKRVIDTNALVAKRLEELSVKMQQAENEGVVAGLDMPVVEVDALLAEENGEDVARNNIIKANQDAQKLRVQAKEEADAMLADARAEAERILNEAKAMALSERNGVLADAKRLGYSEGSEKAQKEYEQLRIQLQEKEKQMEAEYAKCLEELEPKFVDTITGIYEHIFHVELRSYREILTYLIATTMRKIDGNRSFIIHVSKDDYPYVSMQKKQIAAGATASNSSVEIVEDLTLTKNECLIETEGGIFDCGLGTQLNELGQKLRLLSFEKQN